jgi:hypothetical protein
VINIGLIIRHILHRDKAMNWVNAKTRRRRIEQKPHPWYSDLFKRNEPMGVGAGESHPRPQFLPPNLGLKGTTNEQIGAAASA